MSKLHNDVTLTFPDEGGGKVTLQTSDGDIIAIRSDEKENKIIRFHKHQLQRIADMLNYVIKLNT